MSFVERFIILCPYLGESTIGGSTVLQIDCVHSDSLLLLWCMYAHTHVLMFAGCRLARCGKSLVSLPVVLYKLSQIHNCCCL